MTQSKEAKVLYYASQAAMIEVFHVTSFCCSFFVFSQNVITAFTALYPNFLPSQNDLKGTFQNGF